MKKLIFCLFLTIVFFYKTSVCQKQTDINKMKWLIGLWYSDSKTEKSYEEWKWVSDTLLRGRSYVIIKNDTLVNEFISIIKTENGIFYKAEVSNQNYGKAVYFKLISIKNNSIIFENKTHDFPKTIKYTLKDKKNLSAIIEGDSIKYEFKMIKIN